MGDLDRLADQRWAVWIAKGVASDRKARQRTRAVACLVAVGLVIWLMLAMLAG